MLPAAVNVPVTPTYVTIVNQEPTRMSNSVGTFNRLEIKDLIICYPLVRERLLILAESIRSQCT